MARLLTALALVLGAAAACAPGPYGGTAPRGFQYRPAYPLGEFNTTGTTTELTSTLLSEVAALLPEGSTPEASLIDSQLDPNIRVTGDNTNITLTFVNEGGANRNALGFFVFDDNDNVLSSEVLFPDTSDDVLSPGDSVVLGPFDNGTNVGFFVYADGFNQQFWCSSVLTWYSVDSLNLNDERHVALVVDPFSGSLVLGFEDQSLALAAGDYNDAVFLASVDGSFALDNIPVVNVLVIPEGITGRLTLETALGTTASATITSLPSSGNLYAVDEYDSGCTCNPQGAQITSTGTAVTQSLFQLDYEPSSGSGVEYDSFTATVVTTDGLTLLVTVRVDVIPSGDVGTPSANNDDVCVDNGLVNVLTLPGSDPDNIDLKATVTGLPSKGFVLQYPIDDCILISVGDEILDVNLRVVYIEDTGRPSDSFQFTVNNGINTSPSGTLSITLKNSGGSTTLQELCPQLPGIFGDPLIVDFHGHPFIAGNKPDEDYLLYAKADQKLIFHTHTAYGNRHGYFIHTLHIERECGSMTLSADELLANDKIPSCFREHMATGDHGLAVYSVFNSVLYVMPHHADGFNFLNVRFFEVDDSVSDGCSGLLCDEVHNDEAAMLKGYAH